MSSVVAVDSRPARGAVVAVIIAACLISLIGYGVRASFGLYLDPMTVTKDGPARRSRSRWRSRTCCGESEFR